MEANRSTQRPGSGDSPTAPNGATGPVIGCFYVERIAGFQTQIFFIDPANPVLQPPVLDLGLAEDCWLVDAWRALPGAYPGTNRALVAFVRAPRGFNPLRNSDDLVWCFDPVAVTTFPIPNVVTYIPRLAGRAIRIVEENPAAVFAWYTWVPWSTTNPDTWQLAWQVVDQPNGNLRLGPVHPAATQVVISVGARRLRSVNPILPWFNAGYFVYVLRADLTAGVDRIDFHLIDYDAANPAASSVMLSGTTDVTPLAGPGGLMYSGIGDDEPYDDPDDNPCIALALVPLPGDDPSTANGAIAVFTFPYMDPSVNAGSGTISMLTPDGAPTAPRRDNEPLTVVDGFGQPWVFIYNRELDAGTGLWRLHRTRAWVSLPWRQPFHGGPEPVITP